MPSLKEVKSRIVSVNSTQQITKAMKMVAAAKLRKAQDRIIQIRPYSQKLNTILDNVNKTLTEEAENPYAQEREVKKVLVVLITSDRGLCGGFNANVNKSVLALIDEKYKNWHKEGKLDLMPIGNKGFDFFKRRQYPMIDQFAGLFHQLEFEQVREAAAFVMDSFLSGKYDRVELVYNEFKNVATQILRKEQFLPVKPIEATEEVDEELISEYIFEPDREQIVSHMIPYTLKIAFYKALLESNAAEQGARMTAMSQATDNAAELLRQLKLTYNRTRQAAITKEILEIVGGAEALEQG